MKKPVKHQIIYFKPVNYFYEKKPSSEYPLTKKNLLSKYPFTKKPQVLTAIKSILLHFSFS